MSHSAPEPPPRHIARDVSPALVALAALAMAAVGLLVELKPVSLLTGSDTLYIGLAIAAGAAVLAWGVHARAWLRLFTVGVTALCVFNFVQTSHVLDRQRDQLRHRIDNVSSQVRDELPN